MSQALPLVEQLKNLEQLQELDLKIDSIRKNQSSLPVSLKQLDEALAKFQIEIESRKTQMSEIDKARRQAQAALDMNRERLERSNAKLEALHKPQEFQAANKEIEQLKKLGLSLEEQSKRSLEESNLVQAELKNLVDQSEVVKKEREAKVESLSGEGHKYQVDLDVLLANRTQYVSKVEARILAQYNRVRAARGGLGIVPAVGGRCKGCNMVVPPQLYNEVQRGVVLHACPSCNRIIFVPPTSSASPSLGEL